MNKPKAFFVVSAYNNDVSWVERYTDDYIIYDKSHTLPQDNPKIIRRENLGYNIADYLLYIIENYNNLSSVIALLEGNPFDHIKLETFDKLIYNEEFTPLEDYSHIPESYAHKKASDGGYCEINNSWYVASHIQTYGSEVQKYLTSLDEFFSIMFKNPLYPEYVRFSPGGQYLVPKKNILFYSKSFYEKILGFVNYTRIPCEGHIVERALYTIFTNQFREKV